jgi:hypothetical protein
MIKNKNFLSSLFAAIASYFYLVMLTKLAADKSTIAILAISGATFIGSFLPQFILDKFEKDKIYRFDVIPDTSDNGKTFADTIRNNNLAINTYKGYNSNKELVLCCTIFSENKVQSKLIESVIPSGFIYTIDEIKDYKFNHN